MIIDDPNVTTLEGLIRKTGVVNPQHPGYIEEYKPTSGFFPTGEFLGMPVSENIQNLIGQIALLAIGGGIGSKPSYQVLKKMMSKTPGVKASKDVIEVGRTDIIDKAYTGGRMIRGLTSKPTVAPGKGTSPAKNVKMPINDPATQLSLNKNASFIRDALYKHIPGGGNRLDILVKEALVDGKYKQGTKSYMNAQRRYYDIYSEKLWLDHKLYDKVYK